MAKKFSTKLLTNDDPPGVKIKAPRLKVGTKVGMMKGRGFGAGGLPNTIAAPPELAKTTQKNAEKMFAKGGLVKKGKR